MSDAWPRVTLGEVLTHRKEFIQIDDLSEYKRCRVQLHAQGVVLRDTVPGAEIKTKKQQVCRAGEFLVAEIDAKLGGYGIVPPDLEDSIVSSHYFLFGIEPAKLNRRFLDFYIRTADFFEQVAAQGSTNYAAIRPSHVLAYTMPLPPLPEQRRIVERVEAIASRIAEAKRLREETATEAAAIVKAATNRAIGSDVGENWVPLSRYVREIENGRSPSCEARPAEGNEWGVLKVGAVSFGQYDPTENKALPSSLAPAKEYEVCAGDFLMIRANTAELTGACAIVEKTPPRLLLSDKHFRFLFHEDVEVHPRYLDLVLKSPALRAQIERGATGTSSTMKNISKEKVLSLRVPPRPLPEQRRIVAHLDALQAKADALRALQSETATELDALLPSVLNRAFAGEL